MSSIPTGVKKGQARGLEVADFLAWHWNKDFADRIAAAGRPRPMRKDIKALMDLLRIREERIDVRLMTGAALEDFLVAHGCRRVTARETVP